jgi:hypothetical protein
MYTRLLDVNDLEERTSRSEDEILETRRRTREYNNVMETIRSEGASINDILNDIWGDRLIQVLISTVDNYSDIEEEEWLDSRVIIKLTESDFKDLVEFVYTREKVGEGELKGGTKVTCLVCLEDYKNEDKLVELRCGDYFHKECIKKWLLNNSVNCPNCKQDQRNIVL